jgi:predicted anti-sigma-YlaC factor YlaD
MRIGPTVTPVLDVGCTPAHPSSRAPPVARQVAALAEVQLSEVVWPVVMVSGFAVKPLIVAGAAPVLTVTVAELGAHVPPVPEQVSV